MTQARPGVRRQLGGFDFTLLVIGAVVGADIYIVGAVGAAYLGPAQLVAWLIGGVLAALIALSFVQCAFIYPKVGGSYAYAHEAFGPLVGFLTGWALYAGAWIGLSIFPQAFANYLVYFFPNLSRTDRLLVEVLLIAAVTIINLAGVRTSARVNDILTVARLLPILLLIGVAFAFVALRPHDAVQHLTPFAPLGMSRLGPAILIIFWAYAGFEMAVLPAAEVKQPRRTIPRGLVAGMIIVTAFYLLASFSTVVALPWPIVAASPRPLTDAFGAMLTAIGLPARSGQIVMSLGGLISIAGVYDVATLTVARLSYAMAADGVFPSAFRRIHPKFGTPSFGIVFQAVSALIVVQLVGITDLIAGSMFFLGLCYLLTALAALRLLQQFPDRALHVPALRWMLALGGLGGAYLSLQAPPWQIAVGTATILIGLGIFAWRGGGWQTIAEQLAGLKRIEQDRLPRVGQHQSWLLRFVRRQPRLKDWNR
ncbi:APC family permease [Nitrolancea hollandica]|uniref:Putative Amino acid permease n=1 Tax=Nitrolancea hollandica Lb TaxID=1129897 RepID=I4EEK0_9BACT|nr:APC family permease [Nitrolancea hollandica]CCF83112.1 putative Amino acid permease [Nitrolancea hollandica Lb]